MAAIDNAYTYYLTTYGNQASTRYGAHKKSELRDIYQKIVKVNKEAPLYKLKSSDEVVRFAIDIKEGAQHVRNVIASISGSDDIMKALQKKTAVSSQEDVVKARYVGHNEVTEDMEGFDIEVQTLAKPQVNMGNFLKSSQRDLPVDNYSFDLSTPYSGYEFQFSVNPEDTNYSIQNKLAGLISNAGIGLVATVTEDEGGLSALRIESLYTGLREGEDFIFRIQAGGSTNSAGALDILGIEEVSQEAQNSTFLLNGNAHASYSNIFSINDTFELQLLDVSPKDEPAVISFKPNTQAVLENIQGLADAYNSVLSTAEKYSDTQNQSQKLKFQLGRAAEHYRDALSAIGLTPDEGGFLSVDSNVLTESIESEHPSQKLSVLNDFKKALDERASVAALDPIAYVDKVIVAYKNPGQNFISPYASSLYSGMLLDWRC